MDCLDWDRVSDGLGNSALQALIRDLGLGLVWLPGWDSLPAFLLAAAADPANVTRHARFVRRR